MKKLLPYLLGLLALVAIVVLVLAMPAKRNRQLDERITLRQKDKIPYGTFVARTLLPSLFPGAAISTGRTAPGSWDGITVEKDRQAVFLVAKSFEPETEELQVLAEFAAAGNYVFIIAHQLSFEATQFFSVKDAQRFLYADYTGDSLAITLNGPFFAANPSFIYPGKKYDSYFSSFDTARTLPLGKGHDGNVNFVQLQTGRGSIFLHLAPFAFTNYFILHKNNVQYFQKAVSLIPPGMDKVQWNEYYLTKRRNRGDGEPSVLGVLWKYPSFRWALITAMATLLLYVLMEMRRRQRPIPAHTRPANDSLDFVRTMGRLYHDRGDHQNLTRKMATFFLDHVRTRYKLPTHTLDAAFVQELQAKSGYPLEELEPIVATVHALHEGKGINEQQLARFHRQVENFYQNT